MVEEDGDRPSGEPIWDLLLHEQSFLNSGETLLRSLVAILLTGKFSSPQWSDRSVNHHHGIRWDSLSPTPTILPLSFYARELAFL